MTREELKIHCLKQIEECEMWARYKGEEPHGKVYEEHKLILKLLEQQPCEDAISRADAIRIASGYCHPANIAAELSKLPSAQQKIKTGHWIEDENEMKVWCSECGEDNDNCSKFCPNCGAKMVEPQESEE